MRGSAPLVLVIGSLAAACAAAGGDGGGDAEARGGLTSTALTSTARPADLCPSGSTLVFSCELDRYEVRERASLCLGEGSISYHTGEPGETSLSAVSFDDWSNVHLGSVVGGGGGGQNHVRFSAEDGEEIIIFAGHPGAYHDAANGPWAGEYVQAPDGTEHRRTCIGPFMSKLGSMEFDHAIRAAAPSEVIETRSIYEAEGSEYDGWF